MHTFIGKNYHVKLRIDSTVLSKGFFGFVHRDQTTIGVFMSVRRVSGWMVLAYDQLPHARFDTVATDNYSGKLVHTIPRD